MWANIKKFDAMTGMNSEQPVEGDGGGEYEHGEQRVGYKDCVSPLEQLYFNKRTMDKYPPLRDAVQRLLETDGEDQDAWKDYDIHVEKFRSLTWMSDWDGKQYDIVYYGVSGYTGYLMMEYLKRIALKKNKEKFTFAFAGRTLRKVEEMRDREFAGTQWEDTPILYASYDDPISMLDLARSAKVIVNVAGPYMLSQGEYLIDACCRTGTHYVDVSGEIPWTRRTLSLHRLAQQKGVLICPSSAPAGGFPDLLLLLCAKHLKEQHGEEVRKAVVYVSGGGQDAGASGGTLASRGAMNQADDETRAAMADPFTLGGFIPDIDRFGVKECSIQFGTGKVTLKTRKEDMDAKLSQIGEDKVNKIWRGPHPYAFFDTRIVRRSNALLADLGDEPYGRELNFAEYVQLPQEVTAAAAAARAAGKDAQAEVQKALAASTSFNSVADEKAALESAGKYFKQGDGPDLERAYDNWLGFNCYCETASGHSTRCSLIGGDPYFETARAATEMAMTLVFDQDKLRYKGGVLNGAVAGGTCWMERLLASGIKFKMGDWFEGADLCPPENCLG